MAGLIVTYGKSGVGKTLDACRCFRSGLVLLTDRDGLRAVQTLDKRTPRHVRLEDREHPLEEVRKVLSHTVRPLVEAGQVRALIVSTATELAERILGQAMQKNRDPRQAFTQMYRDFMRLVDEMLEFDVWVLFECAEATPVEEAYRVRPGGPKMPGKQIAEDLFSRASITLRAVYDGAGQRAYCCVPSDPLWLMKDRYNVCEPEQPMDLLALMKKTIEKAAENSAKGADGGNGK